MIRATPALAAAARRKVGRAAPLALALVAVTAPAAARADRNQWSVSAFPAYALTDVDSRAPSGGGVGGEVGYGVTESLTLQATGFTSWHPVKATKTTAKGTLGEFAGMLGLNYALDVIRLVPSFDVNFGVLGIRGDADFTTSRKATAVVPASTAFGIGLGFNLDYLITRHIAVGVIVRYHAFLTDITRIPVYLFVGPRVTFRFGG